MAFARPLQQVDENTAHVKEKAVATKPAQPQGNGRRALGDIGNLVGPFNTRCNVGKENAAKKGAAAGALVDGSVQLAKSGGIVTRRAAAAAGVVIADPKGANWGTAKQRSGLRPRDAALAAPSGAAQAPAAKEAKVAGRSMNIDAADKADPLQAAEYVGDIFTYYRRVEPQFRVSPDYMTQQTDINDKMRAILVDWLVEVHLKFKLMPETLFLTTNLIDRFLELKPVTRKNLQLVGVTAMLIASKYEEIWAPEVRDFVYISDRAYTRDQILAMEKLMLNTLRFNLTVPTPFNFLARFLKAAGVHAEPEVQAYAAYLVELALPDYSMLKYSYSMLAAAAVFCAGRALGLSQPWSHALQRHTGFSEALVRPCAAALAALHGKAPSATLVAVYKKYCATKFHAVAKMAAPLPLVEGEA
ncbi:hypothetical protein WJX81_008037 [Elliptochloris bilobata]|uniref:Uncharacterized protein n=1 Tax=Elliptochloris bilobata TaxID=381761 RepID=A0AAW1RGN6_9CHLO